jgi:hypothetical protein
MIDGGKPSIRKIFEREGILLRGRGHKLTGRCPFHDDSSPSLSIDDERGVFYCHGCHIGGDVIEFIRKLKHISFKEALSDLRIASEFRHSRQPKYLAETARLSAWAGEMLVLCQAKLRSIGRKLAEGEEWRREWTILESLADDLCDGGQWLELFCHREWVERVLFDAIEEPGELAPLSDEYRERLIKGLDVIGRHFDRMYGAGRIVEDDEQRDKESGRVN